LYRFVITAPFPSSIFKENRMPRQLAKIIVVALLAAFCRPALATQPRIFAEQKADGAELRYLGDIPVLTFAGTPEEIGRQHAQLVKEPLKPALDLPKRFVAELGLEPLWPFMAQAGRTLMMNAPSRHQQELAAIAKESGVDEATLAVASTLLELRRIGCSTLIVEPERSATGAPLFGRNFDFPTLGELPKYSVLAVYRPEGQHAFASVGFAGFAGVLTGINDGSRKFNPSGTPLAFVFRRILEECTTVDEAEKLLKSETATTWMNLAVCDRDGAAVFEITSDNVARRGAEEGLLRSTNHFRTKLLSNGETCDRYDKLLGNFKDSTLDVEAVHAQLDAARQDRLTFQTMVFEPRELVVHLAIGDPPSSDDPLTRIELRPFFEPADSSR
jgi:isopenicillin-N N-acyltransferase like protein